MKLIRPPILLVLVLMTSQVCSADEIKDYRFLGMKLSEQNVNKVRGQMWNIGGFLQAKSTIKQRNVDKFFTWSNIRDSYYVEFRYDNKGRVVSAKRLYRPATIKAFNQRSDISTRQIAKEITQQIGEPTKIFRKGWGGMPSYQAYQWQDETLTIQLDREGSESLGNIFLKVTINQLDPFFVEQKKEDV